MCRTLAHCLGRVDPAVVFSASVPHTSRAGREDEVHSIKVVAPTLTLVREKGGRPGWGRSSSTTLPLLLLTVNTSWTRTIWEMVRKVRSVCSLWCSCFNVHPSGCP